MGTDKRERQKANRQIRLEELAKEHSREQTKRRAVQVGLVIAAAVVIAAIFFIIGGNDDESTPTTDPPTASTDASTTQAASSTAAPAPTVPGATLTGTTPCPATDGSEERVTTFAEPMSPDCLDAEVTYEARVSTNRGDFTMLLDADKAPKTVASFIGLARYHYFDGTVCHRVVKDFVVQCGDPTGTGTGGPGYTIEDELPASVDEYKKGSLAMANSGADTNGSQFFVVTTDDGGKNLGTPSYSLFGEVTQGLEVVDSLNSLGQADETPSALIQIEQVEICETRAGGTRVCDSER